MVLYKGEFEGRANFGPWLNTRGLTNYGVEVGTHLGEFAEELLTTWRTRGLTCVDPWCSLPEYSSQERFLWGDGSREDHMEEAARRLARFGGAASLARGTSMEVVNWFPDGAFDFVYLDGNHLSPHVYQDLHAWWAKLGPGGVLAGHDFILPGHREDRWEPEVQAAVAAFAGYHGLDVHLVVEPGAAPWSYYMIKKEGLPS